VADAEDASPAQASGDTSPAQASGDTSPAQASGDASPAQASGHAADREWTHDPLERSFFSTIGRGYLIGVVVFGVFGFLLTRSQASDWGVGAAIGAGLFVGLFAGILGGVVLIGLWAMKNEELIRGNETGHAHASAESPAGAVPPEADPSPDPPTGTDVAESLTDTTT
jgi:hypothetical protein